MTLVLTTYDWVPEFPRGFVRDIRVRWLLEELGRPYRIETVPLREKSADHVAQQPFAQCIARGELDLRIEAGAHPQPAGINRIRPLFHRLAEAGDQLAAYFLEEVARVDRTLAPLGDEAQRLRDEATERAEYAAEVERLRGDGLPVLTAEEATEVQATAVAIEDLRTPEGEPVPVEDWSSVTGAAVILTEEWDYPEPATADSADGDSDETDEQTAEDAEEDKRAARRGEFASIPEDERDVR